jgi:hypothetical protein
MIKGWHLGFDPHDGNGQSVQVIYKYSEVLDLTCQIEGSAGGHSAGIAYGTFLIIFY